MAEIDVEQLCVYVSERALQGAGFARRNFPRPMGDLFKPNPSQKMQRGFRYDTNILDWKTLGILAFPRDNDRSHSLKGNDLPVDVEHLRFEKGRAIGCNDGTTLRFDQKVIAKSLMPFHFPGTSG
jgi:hypothetical protein